MKYQAVIFDLFGTLVRNYPTQRNEDILKRMASVLSIPSDSLTQLWHDTFDKRMSGIFQSYQECIRFICSELDLSPGDDQIDLATQIRFEMTKDEVTTPREGAVGVLHRLKSEGYKTGLLSNASTETTTIWRNTPLYPLIDVAVFSSLVGMTKPDPCIYGLATDQLNVKPQDCLYVADGIGQELAIATQIGMHAIQILVPGENEYDPYREKWDGPTISSLTEILELLG